VQILTDDGSYQPLGGLAEGAHRRDAWRTQATSELELLKLGALPRRLRLQFYYMFCVMSGLWWDPTERPSDSSSGSAASGPENIAHGNPYPIQSFPKVATPTSGDGSQPTAWNRMEAFGFRLVRAG
jgi:hypothetical protein